MFARRMISKCSPMAFAPKFNFASLVLAEQFEGKLNANLAQSITAATMMDSQVDVLVHGADPAAQVEAV